jgi:hypothetical protein
MATAEITRAPGAAFGAEWSLLLAACSVPFTEEGFERLRWVAWKPVSWPSLFDLADRHGTAPLLYQALSDAGAEVSADATRLLRERYQLNLHKSLFLARELIRVLNRLSQSNIQVMPYKGVTLAEQMYGDIALRQSGDIDLLICPGDLARIKEAVRSLGYMPHDQLSEAEERAYLRSGYECAFDSPAGRNVLEVQWAIQPRFYAVDLAMEKLFQRAVTVTVAGQAMRTPSVEDQLLILSVHAAKHVWGRLIWLCDIARLMQAPDVKWDWVAEQASKLGIARILGITVLLANQLLGAPIPGALQRTLSEDREASALAKEIGAQVATGSSHDVESLEYFRLMMRLRERKADRVRFVQRLVFTPGPGEWKAVRLPEPLFPLYRLVRVARLAARLARA